MTDSLARAIDELETRRDQILAEYQGIEEALTAIRRISTHGEEAAPSERPARPRVPQAPAPSLVHHNRDQARTARILAFLAAGPQPRQAIARAIGQAPKTTHLALWRLKQAGHVIALGQGAGTKWALPTKRPAAAAAPPVKAEAKEGP